MNFPDEHEENHPQFRGELSVVHRRHGASSIYNGRPAAHDSLPSGETDMPQVNQPQKIINVMGDKSPKSNQKKSSQKDAKTSSANQKKSAAVAAKQANTGKKK